MGGKKEPSLPLLADNDTVARGKDLQSLSSLFNKDDKACSKLLVAKISGGEPIMS